MASTGVFVHFCLSGASILNRRIEESVNFLLILNENRVKVFNFLILDQVSHLFIVDLSEADRNAVVKIGTLQLGGGELLENVPY